MVIVTKLVKFLSLATLLAGVWLAMLQRAIFEDFTKQNELLVWLLPVICVFLFGVYSLIVLVYRVVTFNDCKEAAADLQKEVAEAKTELKAKGIKFD